MPPTTERVTARGAVPGDTLWSGTVALDGDVVVPRGSRLRLAAGTRIEARFGTRARDWRGFARPGFAGAPPSPKPGGIRLVVEGELEALGADSAPVELSGEAWDGLIVQARGRALLRGARIAGAGGLGLVALDFGRVDARGCRFEDCSTAAALACFARARLGRCVFTRASSTALALHDDAAAAAIGCSVERSAFGVEARGTSALRWVRGRIERNGTGAVASGAAVVTCSGGSWTENEIGLSVQDRARFRGKSLAWRRNGVGVETLGRASAELRRVEARLNEVGFWAQNGSRLSLEQGLCAENALGARASQSATAALSDLTFSGHRRAAVLIEEDARGRLDRAVFQDNENGALVLDRGSCAARRCRFERCRDTAVWLAPAAEHRLSENAFEGNGADYRRVEAAGS